MSSWHQIQYRSLKTPLPRSYVNINKKTINPTSSDPNLVKPPPVNWPTPPLLPQLSNHPKKKNPHPIPFHPTIIIIPSVQQTLILLTPTRIRPRPSPENANCTLRPAPCVLRPGSSLRVGFVVRTVSLS